MTAVITIETNDNRTVPLYTAAQAARNNIGSVNVTPFVTFDAEDAFLVGMTQREQIQITGKANGFFLADQNEYSNDPKTALAEWTQELMAVVSGTQGEGHRLTDTERGLVGPDALLVTAEKVGFTLTGGSPFEVEYDIDLQRGEGVMPSETDRVKPADPRTTMELDGVDLGFFDQIREQKRCQIDLAEMLFAADAEENLISAQTGAVRNVQIAGTFTGTKAEREAFEASINGLIGTDETVTYKSPFPGHNLNVMVDTFFTSYQSGTKDTMSYALTMIEGVDD